MTPENTEANNVDRSQIAALRTQLFTMLMALIVVSGTLTIYLYRQSSLAGKDLNQVKKLSNEVSHNEVALKEFVNKLEAYGQKHPNFEPILRKYGITGQPAVAPAHLPAAKK